MTPRVQGWATAAIGVVTAVSLLLPWVRTGGRTRSSIDLLASAGALDVIGGGQRVALLLGWFAIVVAAAGGLLGVAWDRPRLAAVCLAVLGPAVIIAVVAVSRSPFELAWGAWFASGSGATATIGSGLLAKNHEAWREGPSR